MISDIRKELQKTYKPFLWIAAFAMAGSFSIPAIFKLIFSSTEPWIMRVNKEAVSVKQLAHAVQQKEELIAQVRAQYGEYANYLLQYLGLGTDPHAMAMDTLVREAVLNQLSRAIGIKIHEDFVKDMLRKKDFVSRELVTFVPPYLIDATGLLDQRRLVEFLSRQRLSVEWFDKEIEQLLARRMTVDLIGIAHYTPRAEIAEDLGSASSKRKFSIITLPFDDFLNQDKAQEVSVDELKQFFENENRTKKRYMVPEKRSGQVWVFDPATYHIAIDATEAEQYYQDQKERLFVSSPVQVQIRLILIKVDAQTDRTAALKKINAIKEQLALDSQQFALLAKSESQDEKSAIDGGLLPFFAKGTQDPVIERAAFGLKNDGDISPVLHTNQGYALIQRVARKAKEYVLFEQAHSKVIEELEKQKFKKVFAQEVKQALESGEPIDKALLQFSKKRGGKPQEITLHERDESKLMKTLFKLKKGESSFYFEKDEGNIVFLSDIQDQYIPSFEQIEATVRSDFHIQRARKALEKALMRIREEAKTTSLDEIALKYGTSVEKTDFISTATIPVLEKRELPVQQMMQMNRMGTVLSKTTPAAGYFIRLDAIDVADDKDLKDLVQKEKEVTRRVIATRKQQFVDGFIASLCRNATIETNEYTATVAEENTL